MSHPVRRAALATAGVIACALASFAPATPATAAAPTAVPVAAAPTAAPVFSGSSRPAATGDLTGDGIADRVSLGFLTRSNGSTACAYRLTRGLGRGQFAAPVVGVLPVRGIGTAGEYSCPGLGTVLRGPSPAQNQLAVTWFDFGPEDSLRVQIFRGFGSGAATHVGDLAGIYQAGTIGSQDFDGDGWGDVWEGTDQGSGFVAFVGRGDDWRQLYATPLTQGADEQFFDLNRAGGIDVLVTWSESGEGSGAAVVDGKTGAVQVLGSVAFGSDADPTSFAISVIDIDHNAYPDLLVTATGLDDVTTTTRFLNRSAGGRWSFQRLAS